MATFQNRVKAIEKEMTHSEKKIYSILSQTEKPFLLSMNELSKLSEVSEPSVVRFYRRLGYASYQELKVALAQENSSDHVANSIYQEIDLSDSAEQVFHKIIEQTMVALHTTKDLIHYEAIQRAGLMMAGARRLFFFGQGVSGIMASDAAHKFLRLGGTVIPIIDPHMEAIAASHMSGDDVIVAISHSGESQGLIKVLEVAKGQQARIIVITGFSKSSIAQAADELLVTSANETDYRSDAMVSRIVQMAIIDCLYVIAVLQKGNHAIEAVNLSRLAVAKLKI